MMDLLLLFLVAIAVLCILKIQQKREQGNHIAKRFCDRHGLQFLDGTVAFRGFHLARPGYQLAIRFQFDYSVNKLDRFPGYISLVGKQVQAIHVDPEHIEASD